MAHPAFQSNSVAVITGGAAGIGLALAKMFHDQGMRVVLLDNRAEKLAAAQENFHEDRALTFEVDVTDRSALVEVEAQVADRFGGTDVLVNNAGIGRGSSIFSAEADWQALLGVNLWGIIHGTQVFGPRMIDRGRPGVIVNTGSKQGITMPPGNPAYNVSKSGVKAFTEALAHELRGTEGHNLTAHLLIPGFVFTDINSGDRAEKPPSAWTPEQCASFAVDSINAGDFYILCPDNDVDRPTDEKRMTWAVGDIIENRPALSRWHPEWAGAFDDFMKG